MHFTFNKKLGEVVIQFDREYIELLEYTSLRFEDIKTYLVFSHEQCNYTVSFSDFAQLTIIRRIVELYLALKKENYDKGYSWEGEALAFSMECFEKILFEVSELQIKYDSLISSEKSTSSNLNESLFKKTFIPFKFQKEHAEFIISNKRVSDFSSPGAGKTIIGYMAVASMMASNEINSVIVLGPKSAATAWYKEWDVVFEEKTNNNWNQSFNYSNKRTKEIDDFSVSQFVKGKLNVFFVNYHKLDNSEFAKKLFTKFSRENFMLIIDEAHYIKNVRGLRHKAAVDLSIQAKSTLILTGTPVPRALKETYFVISSLWPMVEHGVLAEEVFAKSAEFNVENETFKKAFKSTYVWKNKDDLVKANELKPMHEEIIEINKSETERFIWDHLPKSRLDSKLLDKWDRAILIRLMQAASYPPLLEQSLKESIEELKKDIFGEDEDNDESTDDKSQFKDLFEGNFNKNIEKKMDELIGNSEIKQIIDSHKSCEYIPQKWIEAKRIIGENDERFIVWDIFRKSMDAFESWISKQFPGRKILKVNGTVTGDRRNEAIEKFRRHKNAILIASPATIAESLSLHRECHKAIYLNKNFVGSQWMQSKDRIHRLVKPGEESFEKYIYYINAKESIDSHIHDNLKSKEEIQKLVLLD